MVQIHHVAIILDGNRRHAKEKGISSVQGHKEGAQTLLNLLPFFAKTSISTLTLYVFSCENFKRDPQEIEPLFALFLQEYQSKNLQKKLQEYETRVCFAGDMTLFSQDIQQAVHTLEKKTAHFTKRRLNLAFGYGGRQEILRATKQVVADVVANNISLDAIDEKLFSTYLSIQDDPDIIIRTGGAIRTSNFLPWQSVYSEWFFLKTYWPQITESHIQQVLDEFASRKRNFGC